MGLLFIIIIGLVIGSFLNVVIYRVPRGESLVLPPSHCPSCQHRLGLVDLVPVFSYLGLRGHCRYCQASISCRYPLVELLTAALTVLCWFRFGPTKAGLAALLLTYGLIAIAFIDLDHQLIPNRLTLPLLLAGLALRLWDGQLVAALIGGLIGGGILFLVALLYPQGMGMGDVKLLAVVGVFLGWEDALYTLFAGSLLGTVLMVPLILLKKIGRRDPFPFGPFLAVAALVLLYYGDYLPRLIMP